MKIALIASSYLPRPGGLERHVDELARGLARRGVQVEVLTQGADRALPRVAQHEGVIVRRFPMPIGTPRVGVAPGLWDYLRRGASSFDLADVHTAQAPLGLAMARAAFRRLVFTPHAPVQHLVRWPYTRVTRAIVYRAVQTVCASGVEGDLLAGRFPWAANRIWVAPTGVDVPAIQGAKAFPYPETVVFTVGRLERHKRVDRAIAAMASLDRSFRLVVAGGGPARRRLEAHAADLQVASRVSFVGAVSDAELYRWLRTASVVVTLSDHQDSGLPVIEALSAGVPVVASDIPVHREAASFVPGAGVSFVSPEGSPLEVADAISEAAGVHVSPPAPLPVPSWERVVDGTLALYEELVFGSPQAIGADAEGLAQLAPPLGHREPDLAVES
jgi:glycosyltransferase involved in cell wall biosynthesis